MTRIRKRRLGNEYVQEKDYDQEYDDEHEQEQD